MGDHQIALGVRVVGVVEEAGVAQRHPAGAAGTGDVGAPEIADVGHRLAVEAETGRGVGEHPPVGFVATDLVTEGPVVEMTEQTVVIEVAPQAP